MDQFTISIILSATQEQLYNDWLNSAAHSAFTGGEAEIDPFEDGRFTAWDGYIEGVTLSLEPHSRIVQSWRTLEFPDEAVNSTLELRFEPQATGCKLTLAHSNMPSGDGAKYRKGWQEHYFEPMQRYYPTTD